MPNHRVPMSASGIYSTIMRVTLMYTAGIGLPSPLNAAFITITMPYAP